MTRRLRMEGLSTMEFQLPEIGEGLYEAELVSWLVGPGDAVRPGQNLMEVLTDKATMEVPSPFRGTISALKAAPGQTVRVGDVVLSFEPAGKAETVAEPATAKAPSAPPREARPALARPNGPARSRAAGGHLPVKAAPSVRHLARRLGIDLGQVAGTGPEGRILLEDLSARLAPRDGEQSEASRGRQPPERPDYGKPGTRLKMQGLRRKIAEHMVHAKRTIPHYSYVDECDVTELVKLRAALREPFARRGIKLTYLAFVVKAAVAALKEVPLVNASLDEEAGEIVLHDRYHIGIAVAAPAGLIVPVVHDADQKDLGTVAAEIDRLGREARTGKVAREHLLGGTFTVTSVGNIGGLFSTPVINHPEVGILGLGKIVRRPVYDEQGQVRPADLIYLSFSFDHRVLDGAVGAAFANSLIGQLSNPAALLIADCGSGIAD